MPIPKSIADAVERLQRGSPLSDEDRAALNAFPLGKPGRPPDSPLKRFRKRFGPATHFWMLRSLGIKQDDAEAMTCAEYAISPRSLWKYQQAITQVHPEIRESVLSWMEFNQRLQSAPDSVPATEMFANSVSKAIGDELRNVLGMDRSLEIFHSPQTFDRLWSAVWDEAMTVKDELIVFAHERQSLPTLDSHADRLAFAHELGQATVAVAVQRLLQKTPGLFQ